MRLDRRDGDRRAADPDREECDGLDSSYLIRRMQTRVVGILKEPKPLD